MSKPEIPQDVMDAAIAVLVTLMRGKLSEVPDKSAKDDIATIALALMSAEQRGAEKLAGDLATAIRARSNPHE